MVETDVSDAAGARNICCRPVQARGRLEVENLFLRHQLNVALRQAPRRVRPGCIDRILLRGRKESRAVHKMNGALATLTIPPFVVHLEGR